MSQGITQLSEDDLKLLQSVPPPVFGGRLGDRDPSFAATDGLIQRAFDGDVTAVAELYNTQQPRVFLEVQNETPTQPNLRVFVFDGADGLCCVVTYEMINKQLLVTCNQRADIAAFHQNIRTGSFSCFGTYFQSTPEGETPFLSIEPETGGIFADPRYVADAAADDHFDKALQILGTSATKGTVLKEASSAAPFSAAPRALRPRIALRRSQYASLLTVARA